MRRSDETGRATEAVASDGLPVEPMRRTNRGAVKRVISRYSFPVKRRVILKTTEQQERRTSAPNREHAGTSVRSGTGGTSSPLTDETESRDETTWTRCSLQRGEFRVQVRLRRETAAPESPFRQTRALSERITPGETPGEPDSWVPPCRKAAGQRENDHFDTVAGAAAAQAADGPLCRCKGGNPQLPLQRSRRRRADRHETDPGETPGDPGLKSLQFITCKTVPLLEDAEEGRVKPGTVY